MTDHAACTCTIGLIFCWQSNIVDFTIRYLQITISFYTNITSDTCITSFSGWYTYRCIFYSRLWYGHSRILCADHSAWTCIAINTASWCFRCFSIVTVIYNESTSITTINIDADACVCYCACSVRQSYKTALVHCLGCKGFIVFFWTDKAIFIIGCKLNIAYCRFDICRTCDSTYAKPSFCAFIKISKFNFINFYLRILNSEFVAFLRISHKTACFKSAIHINATVFRLNVTYIDIICWLSYKSSHSICTIYFKIGQCYSAKRARTLYSANNTTCRKVFINIRLSIVVIRLNADLAGKLKVIYS